MAIIIIVFSVSEHFVFVSFLHRNHRKLGSNVAYIWVWGRIAVLGKSSDNMGGMNDCIGPFHLIIDTLEVGILV